MKNVKIYWLFIFVVTLLCSCTDDPEHPGYAYYPDMAYSQAYETQSENPLFADGKTMREPVEGTIPRGYAPFPYEKNNDDRALAGQELSNPMEATPENIKRGKVAYGYYCLQCHGDQGDGQGHLFTSGLYPYPPASLINERMQNAPDGEFYHAITVGFGIMGAHGHIVRPDDRWKIITYIREVLQDQDNS
ncbi:MAG: c-type cytochrome [Bacteroidetes bacterium]|jgi:mono/diheme cytochrome c family protein|nr:c-type cytochrome [Bacteroidota bacterium]